MSSDIPTPRTDAVECLMLTRDYGPVKVVSPALARDLERENIQLRKDLDEARRIAKAYRYVWKAVCEAVDETPNPDPLPWERMGEEGREP